MDLISYDSPNMLDTLFLHKLRERTSDHNVDLSCIQRFIIPLVSDVKTIEEDVELLDNKSKCSAIRRGNKIILDCLTITERGIEMPTMNKNFQGKNYRYVYAAGTFNESSYSHGITKTDLQTGHTFVWKDGDLGDFIFPGEPLFVSNPQGTSEDDGVLISALTDSREQHDDYLLFIDPRNMTEIARAKFKNHIPSALHGLFLQKQ